MELSKVLAISGKPGLFKNVGQSKSGVIVESLVDGKRFPAFAHERISSLAEISVFTSDEDVSLESVFKKVHEKYEGKQAIDSKSSGAELKAFLEDILPDYDQERVYTSDIKKMLGWYNLLIEKDLLEFTEEEAEETAEKETTDQAEPEVDEEAENQPESEQA
nr:DUF5606 domain-containing protein [Bacteroidota bacterium]